MAQALTKIQTGMISQSAQQALQGQTGATGATGASGLVGSTGPQGIQGNVGATGPIGATGVSVTGATGPQGVQGPIGSTGIQGVQGATGEQGVQGPSGSTGPQGATGPQGSTGTQGPVGSTGATGPQGATGLGDKYSTYSTTTLTIGNGTQSLYVEPGLAYSQNQPVIISHTGGSEHMHGTVNGYDRIGGGLSVSVSNHTGSGTFSTWLVNLEGAVGAVGATGVTGASGPQGATGTQGATGAAGNDGAVGATGVTGAQGATGTQGIQGTQGATGPVGATGLTGSTGPVGATGNVGPSGAQGVQGETGSMGASGATGPSGAQGATGSGATGATGLSGDKYSTTSTSTLSLTTGSKVLTVAAGLALSIGQDLILAHDANNRMEGVVSDYNSVTGALTVNVTHILAGSGSHSSWSVSLAGAVGQVGATGATGPAAPVFGGGVLSPRFTGNGATTTFGPLEGWSGPMNDETGYLVYIDGVFQRPDEANGGFTITGTDYASSAIVFPSAIADGSNVDVLAIQVSGARGATGIQGATGPAGGGGGSSDTGKAWDAGITYAAGDVVSYQNILYVATSPSTGETPAAETNYWILAPAMAIQLKNEPLSDETPSDGDVLGYTGGTWQPVSQNSDATSLQSVGISQDAPTSGQVLAYNGTSWEPQNQIVELWSYSKTYNSGDNVYYNGRLYTCNGNGTQGPAPDAVGYGYWNTNVGFPNASAPSDTVNPVGWIDVVIATGIVRKIPYYA